ncbi:MAG: DoxX family protein [Bacteroidetes bacterium GWA2_30_7]|nr:MAG: DoxX family protein [Bacteroidetes bacterium GWA2_30_7]
MKIVRIISRLFVGLLFMFSGFVKGIDPLGSTYKFTDYFQAFGMEWAEPIALVLGFLLSSAEFIIGFGLFFNLKLKFSSWGALIFMSFFTPLTLILAIYNPVTDCGCFGDALKITNWQTFWKNIIIIIPTIIVFVGRKKIKSVLTPMFQLAILATAFIGINLFSFYCYSHLPIIDFRPYKIGTNIPDKMTIPENAQQDVYETIFKYQNLKTKEIKEFNQTNYPWQDTLNWKWVDSKSILVKEGYHPPIHDFVIEIPNEGEITDLILEDENYSFLLIAYDLKKSFTSNQQLINNLAAFCNNSGYKFYCVTSSGEDEINNFKSLNNAQYTFCNADEIMLKTMIRSNPGLVLLKKGTVINMWHYNDIPTPDEFKNSIIKN